VAAAAAAAMSAELPDLKVEVLPAEADIEQAKESLRTGTALDGGRLALVVTDEDAVKGSEEGKKFGAYQIFVKPKLDQRIERDVIRGALMAEITDQRIKAAGEDPARIRALLAVPAVSSQTVLAEGSRRTVGGAQFLLPFAFIMLLWIATMTGGQYLLTTTIEEKSNRIMEVLLSAVSPMQLMVGKILGQMGVAMLVLLVYLGLGTGALVSFKLIDLLEWQNVGLLIVYFLIAFFLIASLMAAVGSAVSEVHEAQSLIGPIMMILIIPMIFSPAIINNPNGGLATALSFVPPVSPFVMVLRIPAAQDIPSWQIAASIAIGLASVVVAAWAAAKIFRIGVLMYGKPPNLGTLIKWVRMA
jgi:ABC-2 type transport system permease protein